MSAKHFVNDPTHLVTSALHSLTLTNPSIALDVDNKIIYRRPSPGAAPQVSIISGGGSGHEPSFAGMVGQGMLSGAVAGTIFASPSAEQIRTAITSRVDTSKGVLVTVMNYTGDVLNFGMAVEKAKAAGLAVEMVVVGDDVGVGRAKAGKVGRRGIAGTVLVHKISGALAALGRPLDEVAAVARLTAANLVSVGASLEHVHVPGRNIATEGGLEDGEVEVGMGIHNEPGSERSKLELPELVGKMLEQLLNPNDKDRAFVDFNSSNETILLINNLGGVSVLELGGITAEVASQLETKHGIRPVRTLSGTFMTSLNGLGFSISLLQVVPHKFDAPGIVGLLDASAEVVGWSGPIQTSTWDAKNDGTRTDSSGIAQETKPSGLKMDASVAQSSLKKALERVIAAEPEVTRYDTVVGDGDCGIGLKRGAEGVLKHIKEHPLTGDVVVDVAAIVAVVENTMDGTSGALYAIFLNALVHAFRTLGSGDASPAVWHKALKLSNEALSKYTPARPGDRTLVDALYPFVDVLGQTSDIKQAAEAARKAADETKGMQASLGRSVYVGGSGYQEVPDPGAWGLACFFLGLTE
ncbi:Dihydroxyacetone kinase 1 [Neonectria ditissima]|uniref:Dihydroxyacetone kinase 1 n=1 Tax=Neonectria ditissima TaxID=78410 RepID=A0A0N8H4U7_9HYPO|nr:Dihydroxyacetone kinase 1 [Neonectria ditissima]